MDRLNGLLAFVRTAELGSFVAAGRVLDLSASAVGKAVARLEQQLQVRLFQRSTRRIQLTEEGRLFHERCRRILDDLDDAQSALSHSAGVPRGRLHVSLPIVGYHFLLPVLPEFLALYPQIELEIDFSDRIVDLIEEGIDVAVRGGDLADSRLMTRALGPFRLALHAAPAYLARHGEPRTVRELAQHGTVRFRFPNSGRLQDWPLCLRAGEAAPEMRSVLVCNNMEALLGAAVAGLGIACLPDFLSGEALARGALRVVLPEHVDDSGKFHAVWPSNRHLSPKVRVFVDFIGARLFGAKG